MARVCFLTIVGAVALSLASSLATNGTCANPAYQFQYGSCWRIISNTPELDFTDSLFQCTLDAGYGASATIASVTNLQQDDYLQRNIDMGPWGFAWLGAICKNNEWTWLNSGVSIANMGFENFQNPDDANQCTLGTCVKISGYGYGGKWLVANCTDDLGQTVCQIPPATPPPTPFNPISCTGEWEMHDNACWKMYKDTDKSKLITWGDAKLACSTDPGSKNGKLATIRTKDENDFAAQLDGGWTLSWIGASCQNGNWIWDDNAKTPVNQGFTDFTKDTNADSCEDGQCLILKGWQNPGNKWEGTDCKASFSNAICNWHLAPIAPTPGGDDQKTSLKGFAIGFPVGMIGAGMVASFFIWKRKRTSDSPLSAAMAEGTSPYAATSTYDNTTPDAIELKSTTSTAHAATL